MRQLGTFAIAALLFALPAGAAAQTGERVNKYRFYSQYPLGALAWVPSARTGNDARNELQLRSLDSGGCYQLPLRPRYWFLVNHRDPDQEGVKGFASIRIVYEFPENHEDRDYVHLYRNPGWYGANGRPLGSADLTSDRIDLGGRDFVDLHSLRGLSSAQRAERKAQVQSASRQFHALLTPGADGSWEHAHLLDEGYLGRPGETPLYMSVRHLRVAATSTNRSTNPVIFDLTRWDAVGATIYVDLPGLASSQSRVIANLRFGDRSCP